MWAIEIHFRRLLESIETKKRINREKLEWHFELSTELRCSFINSSIKLFCMKSLMYFALLGLALTISSFETTNSSSLYSKIESYFSSLNLGKKQGINSESLKALKENIEFSEQDYRHTYLLSGDNSDAVAFAHIILYSWLKEKKFKKADLVSCAASRTISDAGLGTLKEIGYNVVYNNGTYAISFSDKEKPLKLTLNSCDKKSDQQTTMKLALSPSASNSVSSSSTLYYSGAGSSREVFESIATDLYSVIQDLKK